VSPVRFIQTFGGGKEKSGTRKKIELYLSNSTTQYIIWFIGCMCFVFLTAAITQSHRYKSSSDHTGRSSVLDADQLEVCSF
jgi:hypothetical protein